MSNYENHFLKAIQFIKIHENLINCHLVDFLTENLWDKCLPEDLKIYIENRGSSVINEIEQFHESKSYQQSELCEFLKVTRSLKLDNCQHVCTRLNFLNTINGKHNSLSTTTEYKLMKNKKCHEVDVFTKTITWLNNGKSSIIIDAGAGKGYSSLHLSNYYKLPVLAIECSEINHKGAILRNNLVNKKNKQSLSTIRYAVEEIDEATDYIEIVKKHFPDLYLGKELVMTALHACGSLTDSVIKSFLNVSAIKSLCIVPCCYHLASKTHLRIYEFSKNSRMLAQQSVDRISQKEETLSPSLFYRAVLQVVLHFSGIKDVKVGRKAPLDNFLLYAKWAFKKIGAVKVPSDEDIEKIYEKYQSYKWKFHVFQLLRIQLAPVVEAAILLDKIIFIQKADICTKVEMIQLFDPLLSPRNWAIIATK